MVAGTPFRSADIDAEWPWLGPLVQGVDPDDNTGAELRQSCREGRAMCLVSDEAAIVVTLEASRYGTGALELNVRMAVSRGGKGAIRRNDEHVAALARDMGAGKVVCASRHPWMAEALGDGWRPRYTVFERTV